VSDWADEEALKLWNPKPLDVGTFPQYGVITSGFELSIEVQIASALRSAYHRGRVAGLREAQNIVGRRPFTREGGKILREIRHAADKLEAETP